MRTLSTDTKLKILVTGHAGQLGSRLCELLVGMNYDVWGISRREHNVNTKVNNVYFDLRDNDKVMEAIDAIKPDAVYHLAAQASEARGQISPIDMTERNIGIFVNVLTASINAQVSKLIYTSSVSVYGEVTTPYKEDGATIPHDVYGVNKLACEQILKIMSKVYGFNYTIFRPHNIYGPTQNMNDPTRNVVALFMRKLMEGQPYKLFGEGKMRRAFSYVDDVAKCLAESLDSKTDGLTINVGGKEDISIKELSDMLQEITGISVPIELLPARKQEISMFVADHELQDKVLTYEGTPLREGLQVTWDSIKKKTIEPLEVHENEIERP